MNRKKILGFLRRKYKDKLPVWMLLALIASAPVGGQLAVFAITLFTHQVPQVDRQALVTSQCFDGALFPGAFGPSPLAGTQRFKCSSTDPAFTRKNMVGTVNIVFSIGADYTGVSFVSAAPSSTACSGGIVPISGDSMPLSGAQSPSVNLPAGDYDYCLSYDTTTGITGSLVFTWSQA